MSCQKFEQFSVRWKSLELKENENEKIKCKQEIFTFEKVLDSNQDVFIKHSENFWKSGNLSNYQTNSETHLGFPLYL